MKKKNASCGIGSWYEPPAQRFSVGRANLYRLVIEPRICRSRDHIAACFGIIDQARLSEKQDARQSCVGDRRQNNQEAEEHVYGASGLGERWNRIRYEMIGNGLTGRTQSDNRRF